MACDKYLELLSARLEGALTRDEERELEEHFAVCPDCRAAGAQLAALQAGFHELEGAEAPEGFAQGVMDRIREEARPKVVPLFKRPQVRALAGLAACLVLVVGLYGASRPHYAVDTHTIQLDDAAGVQSRSIDGPQVNATLVDPQLEDAPQISSYAAPEDGAPGKKAAPNPAADGLRDSCSPAERLSDSAILVLERMPQGAAELIAPETTVTYAPATGEEGYRWVGLSGEPEALAQIERLAQEQGITAERSSAPAEEAMYHLVILQPDQ